MKIRSCTGLKMEAEEDMKEDWEREGKEGRQ